MRSSDELSLIAAIAEDLPVGVWVASVADGTCVYANEAFEAIMGTKPLPGIDPTRSSKAYGIHRRDGTLYADEDLPFNVAWRARATVVVDDMVVHGRDGSRSFLRAFGKPMFDDGGEITHVAVVFFDVSREIEAQSARARAEAEQIELRARLSRVLDHAPLVLFAFGQDGVVTLCEGQGLARIGLRPRDFVGLCMFTVYPANPIVERSARRALAGESVLYTVEISLTTSGTYETHLAPIRDDDGKVVGALGVSTDVTDRVRMTAQLARAERLASVGLLAAGVAHEVNNPLAYVMGNLDLLAKRIESATASEFEAGRGELVAMLRDAREGTLRMRDIVRDLKVFSGEGDRKRIAVDVRGALEGALRIASNEIRHRARLAVDIQRLPAVRGDEGRIGQLLLNLLINAAQAIPDGASEKNEIRVAARTAPAAPGDDGPWVCVEISDTGVGMASDVLAKIFDPFFTTKPVGSGTGLGLSICHAIVTDAAAASRWTASRVAAAPSGCGSRPPPTTPHRSRRAEAPTSGRRRAAVLLVDDEPQIVKVLTLLLDPYHDVTSEQRADAALQRIAGGERFDVILCDLMMPQMTGMDLHDSLRSVAPDQADAMLFLTGGAFTPRAREFIGGLAEAPIDKPVDPAALIARIDRVAQRRG